jgi:hypothetical protein
MAGLSFLCDGPQSPTNARWCDDELIRQMPCPIAAKTNRRGAKAPRKRLRIILANPMPTQPHITGHVITFS